MSVQTVFCRLGTAAMHRSQNLCVLDVSTPRTEVCMQKEPETALLMDSIDKSFPGVHALAKVSLEVKKGEVHVLLGENGAGKSTLMRILAGAYTKDSGRILIDGQEVNIDRPRRALDLGIAVIYQELNLVPSLNAAENIYLGRQPSRGGLVRWGELYVRTQAELQKLGVDINVRVPVRRLSVANQQMIEICKALSMKARIIVMDEPTSSLTNHEIDELFRTIRRLKETGVSVIYISHRLEEVFAIGDRATILRDGQRVTTVRLDDVTTDELIRLMVGRELTQKFPKQKTELGEEALRVEGLSRQGKLHDVSFSVRTGEILGVFGLMGAGRTEMARAVFGADRWDSGQMFVFGRPVKITRPRDAINKGIGFLTEDRKGQGLVPSLSVLGNVTLAAMDKLFPGTPFLSAPSERRVGERYIRDLNIRTPSMNQLVKYLSGGNQQKVIVARWLCSQSKVLIFDEPTRGIDVGAKVEVYQLMNQLVKEGVAIIMISSELPEILGMSDRILVLQQGRVTGIVPRAEASQERLLQLAMEGI